MSLLTPFSSRAQEGTKTYVDAHGDTVTESSGGLIFRGLAAAGGDAFASDSEDDSSSSDIDYRHGSQYVVPAAAHKEKKSKKEKKEKKEKKSKKSKGSSSGLVMELSPEEAAILARVRAEKAKSCDCGHAH